MAKWGIPGTQTFIVVSGSLTDDFADNVRIAQIPADAQQTFVYVDYTKGTEDRLEVKIEEARVDDVFNSPTRFFQEVIVDSDGYVAPFVFKFTASGKYRVPLPAGVSEDRIRVSVRGYGLLPFSGGAELLYGVR